MYFTTSRAWSNVYIYFFIFVLPHVCAVWATPGPNGPLAHDRDRSRHLFGPAGVHVRFGSPPPPSHPGAAAVSRERDAFHCVVNGQSSNDFVRQATNDYAPTSLVMFIPRESRTRHCSVVEHNNNNDVCDFISAPIEGKGMCQRERQ